MCIESYSVSARITKMSCTKERFVYVRPYEVNYKTVFIADVVCLSNPLGCNHHEVSSQIKVSYHQQY